MTFEINTQEDITEEFLMTLLCKAGEARSAVMQAMGEARNGEFERSEAMLVAAEEALTEVHKTQTGLIGFTVFMYFLRIFQTKSEEGARTHKKQSTNKRKV